ncbi:zinc metallochaperone AztD [Mesorhizobium sp. NPDC059054]|uniref:zinc metallochaperone AztD n=1 Tax=Mesorhizobium sp. NPDC059054 TaxID=3346711 RepID=UPI0036D180FF
MRRLLAAASIAALAVSMATTSSFAEEKTAWRLFVSDHSEPVINVIDALTGNKIETLSVKGPASLYRSNSGRTVFAVQGKADTVSAVSTGITFEDHGDHGDIEVTTPKLTGTEITGTKPSHFVEHGGEFALFFDGEGAARILDEKTALEGGTSVREIKAEAPHHGVAAVYGDYVLLSEPNKEKPDELPVGIRAVDNASKQVGDIHTCPDLHGEATSGNLLLFACASGILLVRDGDQAPSIEHIAYPASLPSGKVTTLLGGKGLQYFLGNYGADRLALIDPSAKDMFRLVDLPTRRVHFAVDPIRPRFAYAFTEDGQLHQVDIVAGKITQSVKLTDPYSMDGHWSDPRPRVAVAGDRIVVTDPLKGQLHLVDATSFAKTGDIPLAGKPFNIVAVGGSGETHATE